MEKQIKVYLQYPWKVLDSPYYKSLIENPPEKIKYLSESERVGVITNKKKFRSLNFLKANVKKILNNWGAVIPNAHLTSNGDYEIIHCAHCLSKNENTPWVADIESWWQFWVSGEEAKNSTNKIKKFLLNDSCKKIMPWSDKTKIELLKKFPNLANKIEVVNPAVPLPLFKKQKNEKIKILFAARYFWIKGGLIALETLKRIQEKYPVEITFISDVPDKIKEKYPEIKILDLVPHEKLIEYYKTSDIFFYPSFLDTFGFSLLEAMSYGLSILTVNTGGTLNCKEIIQDKKTGIIVDFPYYQGNSIYKKCLSIGNEEENLINLLVEKMSLLIENKKIREDISKNCLREIKEGKFSIKKRNEKLKRIYEEIINGN